MPASVSSTWCRALPSSAAGRTRTCAWKAGPPGTPRSAVTSETGMSASTRAAKRPAGRCRLFPVRDLDQVSAGVVEHCCGHRSHLGGFLGEPYAELLQPGELGSDVVHGKGRIGDAVADQRLFEHLGSGVRVGFEHQFGAVRIAGRDDRQPAVLAERYLGLLLE